MFLKDTQSHANASELIEQYIKASLLKHHINPTRQRLEIAKILLAKHQHLSAEQILTRVNETQEKVSKATVYNTLNLFVERGLIKQILIDPSCVFYDSNTADHGHFFNEDSGELIDFDINEAAMPFSENLQTPRNTNAVGTDIIVRVKNA